MAIQIEQTPETPFWVNILFYLSLFLLAISASAYFIFGNSQKNAENEIIDLRNQLVESKSVEELALETYQNKINDFISLLDGYVANSSAVSFIETVTHPKAQFTNIAISAKQGKVSISGKTESLQTLGQQLIIFQKDPLIKETKLTGISFLSGGGEIGFTFELLLDSSLFQK